MADAYIKKMLEIRRSGATTPVPNKKKVGPKRERTRQASLQKHMKEQS